MLVLAHILHMFVCLDTETNIFRKMLIALYSTVLFHMYILHIYCSNYNNLNLYS